MVASTPIVPICAHTAPSGSRCATPSPNITDCTAAAVGSIVITTSAPATASAADAATAAPASASAAVACGDRSHTVVRSPAAIRLRAIAEPMMPVPSTATLFAACPGLSVIVISCLRPPKPSSAQVCRRNTPAGIT